MHPTTPQHSAIDTKHAPQTKPELKHPAWWNPMGRFIYRPYNGRRGQDIDCLTFTTGSAHLKIYKSKRKDQWKVRWLIFKKGAGHIEGQRIFTTTELEIAFSVPHADDLGKEFRFKELPGVMVFAAQGLFFREGSFLNIPCPGSGWDGDPNISVQIYPEMINLIEEFIRTKSVETV